MCKYEKISRRSIYVRLVTWCNVRVMNVRSSEGEIRSDISLLLLESVKQVASLTSPSDGRIVLIHMNSRYINFGGIWNLNIHILNRNERLQFYSNILIPVPGRNKKTRTFPGSNIEPLRTRRRNFFKSHISELANVLFCKIAR